MTGYPYNAVIDGREYILGRIAKYREMPEATAENLNTIVQYTGQVTQTAPFYFNGMFYKCEATETDGVVSYAWEQTTVDFHDVNFWCRIVDRRSTSEASVDGIRLEKGAITVETITQIPELHINDIVYFRGNKYRVTSTQQIPLNTLSAYNDKQRTFINLQ